MKEKECSAPTHQSNCPCQRCGKEYCGRCRKTNVDHFTGKAIGKLLGWTRRELDRPENLQYLSLPCHAEKDKLTCEVLAQLRKQRKGKFIGYGKHIPIGI